MKRIIFCIILFQWISLVCAQSVFDKYEKQTIVKNKIVKKSQWVYGTNASSGYQSLQVLYDEKGNIIEETSFRSTGKVALKRNFKYDNTENVIEYQSYDGQRDKITYKKFVKFDANNRKTLETGFDGVDRFDNKYSYDLKGRLSEINYYISGNLIEKRTITYSEDKQEILIYNAENKLIEKNVKNFDIKENLIKDTFYSPTGTEKKRTVFKYDTHGNLIGESKYFSGNLTESITSNYSNNRLVSIYVEKPGSPKYLDKEFEYDSTGKLLTEKWFDKNTGKFSTKSYKYDAKGNAVEINSYFAAFNFNENVKILYSYQ